MKNRQDKKRHWSAFGALRTLIARHRLSAVGVVLAVVIALLCRSAGRGNRDHVARSALVDKRTVGISLIEQGILVSTNNVPVKLAASGVILEIADSGVRVKEGDVIATIEPTVPSYRWHQPDGKLDAHI